MMFIIGVALLLLLAWLFTVWPLLRRRTADADNGKGRWIFLGLVLTIVIGSGALYWHLGAYHSWNIKQALAERTELQREYLASGDETLIPKVEAANERLLEVLVNALDNDPKHADLQSRALYARTLMGLSRYDEAIEEFQNILSVQPESPQIMAELAQAIFVQANNRVVPIVKSLVVDVLRLDPENLIALGLAGVEAFQAQNYQQAITYWEKAVQQQGANTPNVQALRSGIQRAREYLAQQSPEQAQKEESQKESVEGSAAITVNVSIASLENIQPQDTVFVYARAWQGARVPLAIQRLQVKDFPTTVTLTEAMAMAPGMDINSVDQLELVARISKSGSPVPQSGDWQANYGPVVLGEKAVYELLIKEPVL